MAVIEQDVVFTTKDADGNTVIQMPITRAENIENVMSIEQGGTGATTVANARTNLGLSTAVTAASISGKVITLTFADGTTKTLTTQDTVVDTSALGAAYKLPYATSSTAYNTGAKVATITNGVDFTLEVGTRVVVKFTASNYATTNPSYDVTWSTLNVNSTGAKTIKDFQILIGRSGDYWFIQSNATYEFVYDGTYWNMITPYHKYRASGDS